MAFHSLSRGGKIFVSLGAASIAGLTFNYLFYPYHREMAYTYFEIPEADRFTAQRCEDGFKKLQDAADCSSLLKKHLTLDVLNQLKGRKTKLGATLWDVIRSGVENTDASVGVYAPDGDSYSLFAPLFDAIIADYHDGFGPKSRQPPVDLGEGRAAELPDLDPDRRLIVSTRIRCARTLQGYPFNPILTDDDYLIMERRVKMALQGVTDDELRGTYYPLVGMTKATQQKLIQDHFLFKEGDRHLQAANACRHWPKGRGIFHNDGKTFLVWVNEEDHLRIISMQAGGDVGQVLDRLARGVKAIESRVPFKRDERLGWLTFCPTNLGSTVRASVHIHLPKLSARKDFNELCEGLKLQVRGVHGEHSESEGGVYDVSNKQRLGISEVDAVRQMYDGVKRLIQLENEAS